MSRADLRAMTRVCDFWVRDMSVFLIKEKLGMSNFFNK